MRKYIALAVAAMALGLAPFALADATQSVYDGPGKNTQENLGKPKPAVEVKGTTSAATQPAATSAGGSLPFTGMDLGLVGLAGVGLAVMGYSLRRLARNPDR